MPGWKDLVGGAASAVGGWAKGGAGASGNQKGDIGQAPGLPGPVKQLLSGVYGSARATFDQQPVRVVVVGPVNSGKSTLVNTLTGRPVALVSPVPGTTRHVQEIGAGPFALVDTPGVDEAHHLEREDQALEAAAASDLVIAVFNASVGITQEAMELYHRLSTLRRPLIVALNKIDLVARRADAVAAAAESTLGCPVIPLSALHGTGMDPLVTAMIAADPRVLNVVSELLPRYRRTAARSRIATASALAAGIAWEPLPLADVIPLTILQAFMVLDIAKIYGYRIGFARARELMGTFGGGLLLREGFHQLVKLVPGPGEALGAAYAAAGTAALGAAAILWFESGQKLTPEEARTAYRKTLADYSATIRALPGRSAQAVKARMQAALNGVPEPPNLASGDREAIIRPEVL